MTHIIKYKNILRTVIRTYTNVNTEQLLNTTSIRKVAKVKYIADSIIEMEDYKAFMGEVMVIPTMGGKLLYAVASRINKDSFSCVLLEKSQSYIYVGDLCYPSYTKIQTRTGFGILGRTINPLGHFLDTDEYENIKESVINSIFNLETVNVMAKSPSIIERESVTTPFFTGIATIDYFTPIGCGQRQLIIGDFGTGKTSLAVTMILNQRYVLNFVDKVWRSLEEKLVISFNNRALKFIPCIFVAIGKRRSETYRLKKLLTVFNCMYFTTIIHTSADSLPSLQYFAPYAGCAIGEWFRDRAYNALVIFDDLSQHAIAYRQLTLLLRIPPGREAYPGDVFYVQARLLERGSQLSKNSGAGSLTILPLIETKGGDISAYIPTNVISITDGQIFLSSSVANKGLRPGVNIGLSVSRVGSRAQYDCIKYITKRVKKDYVLYKTYEGITKISSDIDPVLLAFINRGNILLKRLSQKLNESTRLVHQVLAFYCLTEGYFDNINLKYMEMFFDTFFNCQFVNNYLRDDSELFKFLFDKNFDFLESLLISTSIEPYLNEISKLFKLYTTFFKNIIETKLNENDIHQQALVTNSKI